MGRFIFLVAMLAATFLSLACAMAAIASDFY